MFSWLLSFVPTWVWVVLIAAAVLLTAQFWMPIWRALPTSVRLVVLGVLGTLGGILWGRSRGRKDARDEQARRDAAANRRRLETEEEVRRLTDPERRKERDRWTTRD